MPEGEFQDKFPGFRDSETMAPTELPVDLVIGNRSVHAKIGVCLDSANQVSLVLAKFPVDELDFKEVHAWLTTQYGAPLPIGVSDSVGSKGEWIGNYDEIVFDRCPQHGCFSFTEKGRRVSAMSLALVKGAPVFLTREPNDRISIDHDKLAIDAWKYGRCAK